MRIVVSSLYGKAVKKLLSVSEREAMELALVADPLAHPVIPRTGGFRKARWGRGNRGKSGGVRTVFYYYVKGETIYLEFVYAKNEKETLTRDEENYLRYVADAIESQQA